MILGGCDSFLDEKPRSSLAILETLDDFKAVIQNEVRMNSVYPFCFDYASDYFYLEEGDFNAIDETGRFAYIWEGYPAHVNNWNQGYVVVYDANVVLDGVDEAVLGSWSEKDRKEVKGSAFFFKAYSLHYLVSIFASAYEPGKSEDKLGIPLRLTSDINEKIERATLEDTYRHIEELLLKATELLPLTTKELTLPSKEAAWAVLARHYLNMQDYEKAEAYADSCLLFNDVLLDYNLLDTSATNSQFPELNKEVIFHANKGDFSGMLLTSRAKVDTSLLDLYAQNDLRKKLYFKNNEDGSSGFYGDYTGKLGTVTFSGIARDEIYLIAAESSIRIGNIEKGGTILNELLKNRMENYHPLHLSNSFDALELVLNERQKSLAFRSGLRWMDLKRLNLDESTKTTLYRKIGDDTYVLEPNSPRYVFKIPENVIAISGIEQNP